MITIDILPLSILFLLIPIFIIFLGKIANLIIKSLNMVASRSLIFNDHKLFIPLFLYYLMLSILMSFLIENSLLFSNFELTELEIALIALSLAFLPRVIGFTAAHEQTRVMLLSILTPLTTLALPLLILKSKDITFSLELVKYCFLGSLTFSVVGELWILAAQKVKILVKSPEYQKPDFLDGVRAKPWEQDWESFIKDFNNPDFEYVRPIIINAFKIGLEEAKNSTDLILQILSALRNVDYSIEDSSKFSNWWIELAKDEYYSGRPAAALTLREISKLKPDEILPILKKLAGDEDRYVRQAATDALREIGELKSDGTLPILKKLAGDEDRYVRQAAVLALREIGKLKPDETLPILKELAGDEDPNFRRTAVLALREVGKLKPDETLPILKKLEGDEDHYVRRAAALALGEIGKLKPDETLPILKALVRDKDHDVRRAAAYALEKIGKLKPDETLPILKTLAGHEDRYVRRAAALALEKIGKVKPDETLPILKELTGDKNPDVRRAAAYALSVIGKKN